MKYRLQTSWSSCNVSCHAVFYIFNIFNIFIGINDINQIWWDGMFTRQFRVKQLFLILVPISIRIFKNNRKLHFFCSADFSIFGPYITWTQLLWHEQIHNFFWSRIKWYYQWIFIANETNTWKQPLTRTTRMPAFWYTPAAPWLPILVIHIRSQVKLRQSQSYKFKKKLSIIKILEFCKKLYTWHTFWSCLIRCINMKWLQPEL